MPLSTLTTIKLLQSQQLQLDQYNYMLSSEQLKAQEPLSGPLAQIKQESPEKDRNKNFTSTFHNPICRQTLSALPKIYGSRKKRQKQTSFQKQKSHKLRHHSTTEIGLSLNKIEAQQQKKQKKLSQPKRYHKINTSCSKKNCFCHQTQQNISKMTKKFRSTKIIKLPEIQKFQLDDLQSRHKVFQYQDYTVEKKQSLASHRTEAEHGKIAQRKASISDVKRTKKILVASNNPNKLSIPYKQLKKLKARINKVQFKISNDSEQSNEQEQQENDKLSSRLNQQSTTFSKSVILNTNIFSKKNGFKKTRSLTDQNIQNSQYAYSEFYQENGNFRIPQQPKYIEYLKAYPSINLLFNLSFMTKSPSFKIMKMDKGVYFGQFDNQESRCGFGLQITEKEIFQGRFFNDMKHEGCERNSEGIYVGGFKNGLRSGLGAFYWKNGQKFEGNWQFGLKNGYGEWSSPQGANYKGQWLQNKQHGQGVFTHHTSVYKGTFKNFLKDGKGEERFSNGDRYIGQYKLGKPNGKGRYQWSSGGYYDGQFCEGLRQGRGKWVSFDKSIYEVRLIQS